MYKSKKLQMDGQVYIYISVTVTLDGGQDKIYSSRAFTRS